MRKATEVVPKLSKGYQPPTHFLSLSTSPGSAYDPSIFALCSDHNLPRERESVKTTLSSSSINSLTQTLSHYHILSPPRWYHTYRVYEEFIVCLIYLVNVQLPQEGSEKVSTVRKDQRAGPEAHRNQW